MKNISLLLNALLLAAVAYLYYLHFADGKPTATTSAGKEIVTNGCVPEKVKTSKIVYINADSLFDKYEYVKEIKKSAESHKAILEKNYNSKAQRFQDDYMEYQQRASQGAISLEQAKATEDDLMKRKMELEAMEDELSRLIEDTQRKNSEIQQDITTFLTEHNNNNYNYVLAYTALGGGILYASDSLDITNEVVEGLNKRYTEKKNTEKSKSKK